MKKLSWGSRDDARAADSRSLGARKGSAGRIGGGHDGEDTEDALIGRGRMACGGPAPKL